MTVAKEYITAGVKSPFGEWFEGLDRVAALKVTIAIKRMENGNFSNSASVGSGVWESKINFGPGYRVYYGKEGEEIIILLGGGTKKQQQKDIDNAKMHWREYKKLIGGH